MTDFSFDFNQWDNWRDTISWSVRVIGFLSGIWALSSHKYDSENDTRPYAIITLMIFLFMLGLFPIEWGYGTDRANYASIFVKDEYDFNIKALHDIGFVILSKFLRMFLDVKQYFLVLTFIYLTNYYIAISKIASTKSLWLTVVVITSFGFTSYILNTMRAGLALSFIVLSISYYPTKRKMLYCMLIAVSIHMSSIIPALMILISCYYNNTNVLYKLWFLSIPLSFIAGGFFMSHFALLSDDSRTNYLTNIHGTSYNVGFRVNFIIYSLTPILVGAYYIFKKNFRDNFYTLLYNSYILTNIFWILVIRANYTDRFAYLSWFLMPFVLTYPLLRHNMELKENIWLGIIILGETLFGFII